MGKQIDVNKLSQTELEEIFIQGDGRYNLTYLEDVYDFFISQALILEREKINDFDFTDKELSEIEGPQKLQKATATKILLGKGYSLDGYEINMGAGIVDVLGRKGNNKIAIECGSCRISKAINYFKIEEIEELWLVQVYYDTRELFIIKRGPNWKEQITKYDNKILEEIKKIKSPFDEL